MSAEQRALLRLINWLSPSLPTGGYSYSHGLEMAVAEGCVGDREGLQNWLGDILTLGSGWNDAVMLAETWRTAGRHGDCRPLARLAEAMAGGAERHLETMAQGQAFMRAVQAWHRDLPGGLDRNCPLPIAVGAVAGIDKVPLLATATGYLNAFVSNLVQAAQRLMPLGQQGGVEVLAGLEPVILSTANQALDSTLNDLGGIAVQADRMSLTHEQQPVRIFRT